MKWFGVLKAARKLKIFTSGRLGEEVAMPTNIATGWISKFVDWGYVRATPEKRGRFVVYEVTDWGYKKYAPKGPQATSKR